MRIRNRKWIEGTNFYGRHRAILDAPRGAGFWLWKPFLIQQALLESNLGDVIVYADAGMKATTSIKPLVELARKKGIVLFAGQHISSHYTKRKTFQILDADHERFHNWPMIHACILVLENSIESRKFIAEWLDACLCPGAIDDSPSEPETRDFPEFRAHRHDQSILSIVSCRNNLLPHRDPTQFGEPLANVWPGTYPTIFYHHRRRNVTCKTILGAARARARAAIARWMKVAQ